MNLSQWWKPTLTVIGINGLPSDLNSAGNVVYKELTFKISIRTGPTQDCDDMLVKLRKAFLEAPPEMTYNAKIDIDNIEKGNGFCAPDLPEKAEQALY